jgi:hypothetical protein
MRVAEELNRSFDPAFATNSAHYVYVVAFFAIVSVWCPPPGYEILTFSIHMTRDSKVFVAVASQHHFDMEFSQLRSPIYRPS